MTSTSRSSHGQLVTLPEANSKMPANSDVGELSVVAEVEGARHIPLLLIRSCHGKECAKSLGWN